LGRAGLSLRCSFLHPVTNFRDGWYAWIVKAFCDRAPGQRWPDRMLARKRPDPPADGDYQRLSSPRRSRRWCPLQSNVSSFCGEYCRTIIDHFAHERRPGRPARPPGGRGRCRAITMVVRPAEGLPRRMWCRSGDWVAISHSLFRVFSIRRSCSIVSRAISIFSNDFFARLLASR
jgi:hypothetical protein